MCVCVCVCCVTALYGGCEIKLIGGGLYIFGREVGWRDRRRG